MTTTSATNQAPTTSIARPRPSRIPKVIPPNICVPYVTGRNSAQNTEMAKGQAKYVKAQRQQRQPTATAANTATANNITALRPSAMANAIAAVRQKHAASAMFFARNMINVLRLEDFQTILPAWLCENFVKMRGDPDPDLADLVRNYMHIYNQCYCLKSMLMLSTLLDSTSGSSSTSRDERHYQHHKKKMEKYENK